jgi:hypothetical protein
MILKRFNDMHNDEIINEAKSPERKKLEVDLTKHLVSFIKTKGLTRYDMIQELEKKMKGNKNSKTIARSVADIIVSDPGFSKYKVKTKNVKGKVLFSIGDLEDDKTKKDAKKDAKKDTKKDVKNESKKDSKKIQSFDDFDEKDAKAAKNDAEKDMDKEEMSGRSIDFKKDSDKQLEDKLKNKKFKNFFGDIKDELKKRKDKPNKDKKATKEEKSTIDRFDQFKVDKDDAKAAKNAAEKDMDKEEMSGRSIEFKKDSDKQLETKLKNKKYKNFFGDIKDELKKRNK